VRSKVWKYAVLWAEKKAWLRAHPCECGNLMCINPSLNLAFQHQHPEAYKADAAIMYGSVPANLITGPDSSTLPTGDVGPPVDRGIEGAVPIQYEAPPGGDVTG